MVVAAPRWVYALSNECETGSNQACAVSECIQVTWKYSKQINKHNWLDDQVRLFPFVQKYETHWINLSAFFIGLRMYLFHSRPGLAVICLSACEAVFSV